MNPGHRSTAVVNVMPQGLGRRETNLHVRVFRSNGGKRVHRVGW